MQEIADFVVPDWAKNQSVDEIHREMLESLPSDMDKTEGGFPWDFTRPTAIEKSEMVQFILMEAIKNIFPQWAYGNFLNYHAENRGMERKAAIPATVTITVVGTAGAVIKSGYKFSTAATTSASAIEFATTNDVTIGSDGKIDVVCKAVTAGVSGNVVAKSVIFMAMPLSTITSVTNTLPATGGTAEEDDDTLRQRILEYDRSQGTSFVGSDSDYKRWAESRDMVGSAKIVDPTWITTNGVVDDTIKIILTGSDGAPATQAAIDDVRGYIMGTAADLSDRLAPVNAKISVIPTKQVSISVSSTITLDDGYTLASVNTAFLSSLKNYLKDCTSQVMVNKIGSLLMNTGGVKDYAGLLVNGGTSNIILNSMQTATTDSNKVVLS